jgi:hypothetical protein
MYELCIIYMLLECIFLQKLNADRVFFQKLNVEFVLN